MMRKMKVLLTVFLALLLSASLAVAAGDKAFKAKMTGKQETPPVKTKAGGTASFKVSPDGKEMKYKVTVKNIMDVTAAHIHEGKKGKSGPPVVNLFTGPKKTGKFSGTLAEGTITDKDLSGSLQGKSLDALAKMIKAGDAYVNVHTDKNPDGELRGQIK